MATTASATSNDFARRPVECAWPLQSIGVGLQDRHSMRVIEPLLTGLLFTSCRIVPAPRPAFGGDATSERTE